MSLYNIIAFACKRGTPGSRLPAPKLALVPLGPNPGEDPVVERRLFVGGEAWEQGSAEGWGGVNARLRSTKTRHIHKPSLAGVSLR